MHTFATSAAAPAACALAIATLSGCGFPSDKAGLPRDLPAPVEVVFNNPERFAGAPGAAGTAVSTGTVVDALAPLDGCWGAYTPDVAQGTEGVEIEDFTVIQFGSDGDVEWWTIESAAGFSALLARRGHYEVLGGNRVRITERELVSYNPLDGRFESTALDPPVTTEYLATRIDEVLKLLMLDPTEEGGTPVPETAAIVLTQFDCPQHGGSGRQRTRRPRRRRQSRHESVSERRIRGVSVSERESEA